MTVGARARIRLPALTHNLSVLRQFAGGARVMAVVKANAYGHGMLPVAKALSDVDCLAVARLSEARMLREGGVTAPIAVLGGLLAPDDIGLALDLDVQLGVHDHAQLGWLAEHGGPFGVLWLKIDTGMNRLGLRPEACGAALDRLGKVCADVRLMTHFANADDPGDPMTRQQLEKFMPLIESFDGHVSVANSAGLIGWQETLAELSGSHAAEKTWIRPGLTLYGISPFGGKTGADLGLRPVMQFESRLLSVKALAAGEAVGYGGTWHAPADTMLGVIAAGYGDGYTRFIGGGTPVLINGRRVPVIGRVSMDMTAVDLGASAEDRVGDKVVLWGDDLAVEEVAIHAATIPYQLVTGITHREAALYE